MPSPITTLSPADFKQQMAADSTALLLDVRTESEYAEAHLPGAAQADWLSPERFKQAAKALPAKRTIYVYCRSGRRSHEAAGYLSGLGYRVVDLQGGFLAWQAAGLPTVP